MHGWTCIICLVPLSWHVLRLTKPYRQNIHSPQLSPQLFLPCCFHSVSLDLQCFTIHYMKKYFFLLEIKRKCRNIHKKWVKYHLFWFTWNMNSILPKTWTVFTWHDSCIAWIKLVVLHYIPQDWFLGCWGVRNTDSRNTRKQWIWY